MMEKLKISVFFLVLVSAAATGTRMKQTCCRVRVSASHHKRIVAGHVSDDAEHERRLSEFYEWLDTDEELVEAWERAWEERQDEEEDIPPFLCEVISPTNTTT